MLGAVRPSKRNGDIRSPRIHQRDRFYREKDLDEVYPPLSRRESYGSCPSIERHPQAPLDSIILRLNVGGVSYRLLPDTILKRSTPGLLGQFVFAGHESRLLLCTGFFQETQEYFFERSAHLFDLIYQFYVTGIIHKPTSMCLDVFAEELHFWKIKHALFAECCLEDEQDQTEDESASEHLFPSLMRPNAKERPLTNQDEFEKLRCGKLRQKIWNFMEVPESSKMARIFGCLSLLAVLIATGILVASSVPDLQVHYNISETIRNETTYFTVSEPHPALRYSEYVCMGWFTAEYVTKISVAANRRRAFCEILSLVDLIALVPFYFELTVTMIGINSRKLSEFNGALLMMRVLRVSRVIRIFKLGRYSSGLRAFARTLSASKKQLSMLAVVLTTGVLFFSTLVYNLEKDAPNTQFVSIPAAFWWCIVTMTTVGYGDMVPMTNMGKLVGGGAIACGVLVLALPITIIVDNFMKVHEEDLAHQIPMANPIVMHRMSVAIQKQHKSYQTLLNLSTNLGVHHSRVENNASKEENDI